MIKNPPTTWLFPRPRNQIAGASMVSSVAQFWSRSIEHSFRASMIFLASIVYMLCLHPQSHPH